MDVPEPDQSPFTAVTAHTSKLTRVSVHEGLASPDPGGPSIPQMKHLSTNARLPQHYQAYLDASTPYATYRWVGSAVLLLMFFLRIVLAQGWYIGTFLPVCH